MFLSAEFGQKRTRNGQEKVFNVLISNELKILVRLFGGMGRIQDYNVIPLYINLISCSVFYNNNNNI